MRAAIGSFLWCLVSLCLEQGLAAEDDLAVILSYVDQAYDLRTCHFTHEFNTSANIVEAPEQGWSRSVSPTYLPRVLSTGQISWKSKGKSEGSHSSSKNQDKEGDSTESAASKKKTTKNREYKDEGDVVHRFLAFALALPRHPFSADFLTILKAVAPLYPDVAVIVGNGEEFADFSSQYNVRSFPKLLVFNWGMLHSRVSLTSSNYSEEELSKYFHSWTGLAPAAAPLPLPLRDWSGRGEELTLRNDWDTHGAYKVAVRHSREGIFSKTTQVLDNSVRPRGGNQPRTGGRIALSHSGAFEGQRGEKSSDPLYFLLRWWSSFVSTFFVDTLEPSMNSEIDAKVWLLSALYVGFRLAQIFHRKPPLAGERR